MQDHRIAAIVSVTLVVIGATIASAAAPTASRIQNSGDIVGVVTHCGTAYQGTQIYIPGTSFEGRADANGSFRLSYVQAGTYDLVFSRNTTLIGVKTGVIVESKDTTDAGINDYCIDQDGDGYSAPADCDDANPNVNPDAIEVCGDGFDNDCDALAEEGCSLCLDLDGDGFYGQAGCGTAVDCDDLVAGVNPEAVEICNDGIDNNCNGEENEAGALGETTFYEDADLDTWGDPLWSTTACTAPAGYSSQGGDCNDNHPDINPGAPEICGDGIDNNCDLEEDEGCHCANPAVCDDGLTCTEDICDDASGACSHSIVTNKCLINDTCYDYLYSPTECQICDPARDSGTWSNVSDGDLCSIGVCLDGACYDHCDDGVLDFAETDVDCGGSTLCDRCAAGETCAVNADCSSGSCAGGVCL